MAGLQNPLEAGRPGRDRRGRGGSVPSGGAERAASRGEMTEWRHSCEPTKGQEVVPPFARQSAADIARCWPLSSLQSTNSPGAGSNLVPSGGFRVLAGGVVPLAGCVVSLAGCVVSL